MQDLYIECYRTLKEIKLSLNEWKDIQLLWIVKMNIVRWQYFPNWFTDSMQSVSKSLLPFLQNGQPDSKTHRKLLGTPKSQNNAHS